MSRWKAMRSAGLKAAAASVCAALVAGAPLMAIAAEATNSAKGREAAASVISEASDEEEYGSQVVDSAGDVLSDENTSKAIDSFISIMEDMLISKSGDQDVPAEGSTAEETTEETEEIVEESAAAVSTVEEGEGPAGRYHFSGAGRSSAQIKRALESLRAYISEQGERVTGTEGQFFVIKGTTQGKEEWSVTYLPGDMQLRFVYRLGDEGSSAMVRMSYDMETFDVSNIGLAVWGSVESVQYASAWEAPFHRVLSTNVQDFSYEVLYSNFKEGHEAEYLPVLTALSMSAFDCWQDVLTRKQSTGLGELGFGLFDTTGWVRNADGKWMYLYRNGTYAASGWKEIGGKWFHFDGSGLMETGWIEENGNKYYCGENGVMVTGTVTIGTEEYTFDENGVLQK